MDTTRIVAFTHLHCKPRLGRFYKAVFLTAHTASVLLCLLGNRQLTSLRSTVFLWVVKDLSKRQHADSENSYQSVCMHRFVFQGCTCSFKGNTVARFKLACDVFSATQSKAYFISSKSPSKCFTVRIIYSRAYVVGTCIGSRYITYQNTSCRSLRPIDLTSGLLYAD